MASRLYERLEIGRNASADEIRRAFHKQALKSHPDRLPRGHSAADKANAEEQFRLVSQAYEVLSDPEKRRVYDNHGTYPPPQAPQFAGGSNSQRSYQDTRDYRTNGRAAQYTFKDPFELFEEVFREMDRSFAREPFFNQSSARGGGGMDLFSPFMGFNLGRAMLPIMPFSSGGAQYSSSSFSFSSGSNNGVQQKSIQRTTDAHGNVMTIESHTDSNGNEHVKKTYPDGHVSYRVNGERQALPGSAPAPPLKQITRPPQSSHAGPPALPYATRPSPMPNMAWSTTTTDGYNDNPRQGGHRQGSQGYSDYPHHRYDPPLHAHAGHRANVYDPTRYDY